MIKIDKERRIVTEQRADGEVSHPFASQEAFRIVSEAWLQRLIAMGVHYVWFHTYRVVGPNPNPQPALRPEQVLAVRIREPHGIWGGRNEVERRSLWAD